MSSNTSYRRRVRRARLSEWIGKHACRDTSLMDRLCRRLIERTTPAETADYMKDEIIDLDLGYDADELDRYQRGETILHPNVGTRPT